MKAIHSIEIETFLYPSEDEEKVKHVLGVFSEEDVSKTSFESYYGPSIHILKISLNKALGIKECVQRIKANLSESDKKNILESLENRVDETGNMFLRFSKQDAFDDNLVLQYKGDVVKVKIQMAAYPVSHENYVKIAGEVFA